MAAEIDWRRAAPRWLLLALLVTTFGWGMRKSGEVQALRDEQINSLKDQQRLLRQELEGNRVEWQGKVDAAIHIHSNLIEMEDKSIRGLSDQVSRLSAQVGVLNVQLSQLMQERGRK